MQATLSSISTARLALLVVGALGDRQTVDRLSVDDFLPFPLESFVTRTEASVDCQALVRTLIRERRLPMWAIVLLTESLRLTAPE